MRRAVVMVGYEGVQALDVVGPCDVFNGATTYLTNVQHGDHGYDVTVAAADAGQLAADFPAIDVTPEPIFLRSSEKVWTAAGVTSGIDLTLALVEDDYGTDVAQEAIEANPRSAHGVADLPGAPR